jgi:DNA repair protein RadA/Sms
MAKARIRFVCQSCGQVFTKWQGQCTACQEWNTIEQEADAAEARRVPMQNPGGSLAIIQTL